jgi:hypothetical protein
MKTTSWWAFASLLVPSLALAQEPPPPMTGTQPVEESDPILPNLLPTRAGTTVDLGIDYVDVDNVDVYFLAARAHVQYLMPQGLGGYLIVPLAVMGGDDVDSETQLGNIEVGGLYKLQQASPTAIMLRGGVSIDTHGDPDDLNEVLVNLAHAIPRPTDAYALGGFNTTWARAQVQVTSRVDKVVFGGMGGVDIPVAGDGADSDTFDAIVNIAGAVGYDGGEYGAAVGLTVLQPVTDGDDELVKNLFLHGNMVVNPTMRIYGGFGLPMDDDFIDGIALMFGVRAGI